MKCRARCSLFAVVSGLLLGGLSLPAMAAGDAPDKATPVQREQAQSRFLRGQKLYASKKYEQALVEFRASFDIVASPNTHLLIGRALRELGKYVEAYVELGRTEVEANELARTDSRYKKAGESANIERRALSKKLAFVSVTVEKPYEGTTLRIGGEEARRAGWGEPFPVMAGTAEIVVESPDRLPLTRSVTVKVGDTQSITIDASKAEPKVEPKVVVEKEVPKVVKEPPKSSSGMKTGAIIAGVVGVAGLATFTIEGLAARSAYNTLDKECGGPCPPARQADIDAAKKKQTIANIGLVIGVVGVATSITLFVLAPSSGTPKTEVSIGPGTIWLRGSF